MIRMHRFLPLILLLSTLGCVLLPNMPELVFDSAGDNSVPLPDNSVQSLDTTVTPNPVETERLPTDWIWIGVEGFGNGVLAASTQGQTRLISLPLNEEQTTSDVIASADGQTLIYLVWEDETQLGVAAWNLSERDARLVLVAPEGERIIYITLRDDGSQLAYVVTDDTPLTEETAWRVESIPLEGGEASVLLDSETLPGVFPPRPFAWPVDGDLYLSAVDPQGRSQGVFAVDPVADSSRVVKEANIDEVLVAPVLSPEQSLLAYLSYEPERLPESLRDVTPTNVVRVVDVETGEIIDRFAPEEEEAILGVQWRNPENLLVDISQLPADERGFAPGIWASADLASNQPWRRYGSGPDHELVFDFAPFGEGIAYTTLSADGEWKLFVLPELSDRDFEEIPLKPLQQRLGAPVIIYTPNS